MSYSIHPSACNAAEMEWELAVFCFDESKLPKKTQTNHFCTKYFNKNMCFFSSAESGVYILMKKPCPTFRLARTKPWFHHTLCTVPQTFPVRGQQYLKLLSFLVFGRWTRLFGHGYAWEPVLLFPAHRLRHHPKLPDNYCHTVWWVGAPHCGIRHTHLNLTQYLSLSDTVVQKGEWPEKKCRWFSGN